MPLTDDNLIGTERIVQKIMSIANLDIKMERLLILVRWTRATTGGAVNILPI